MSESKHTPGPWEYVPSSEHHGPYVAGPFGGDICDCYTMSQPQLPSTLNGGPSRPIHFQAEMADANARLIAAAPDLYEALKEARETIRELVTARWSEAEGTPKDWTRQIDAALSRATTDIGGGRDGQ